MTGVKNVQRGGCLCGGVRYRVTGPTREVTACHCRQCARSSGNFVAATNAALADFALETGATLTWFRSSADAERGFCSCCGGNLFWRRIGADSISIMAGTLDPPTGLRTARHIFVGSKSDFYDIADDAKQHDEW